MLRREYKLYKSVENRNALTVLYDRENYEHFIARIKGNLLAVRVKLNDLKDNMDITRLSSITEEDMKRLNKYLKAYHSLLDEE